MNDDEIKKSAKKSSEKKKSLVKVKQHKQKANNNFSELTFIEEHMKTFYIGLNSNYRGAYNPKPAREVPIEDGEQIVKDWIQLDKQLVVKPNAAKSRRKSILTSSSSSSNDHRYEPLKFVKKKMIKCDEEEVGIEIENEEIEEENHVLLRDLFDDTKHMKQQQVVVDDKFATPVANRYRVFVDDTPVDYYGLSVRERKINGFNF